MLVERARVHEWTSNTILVMTKQRHPLKQWTDETENTSGSSHQRQGSSSSTSSTGGREKQHFGGGTAGVWSPTRGPAAGPWNPQTGKQSWRTSSRRDGSVMLEEARRRRAREGKRRPEREQQQHELHVSPTSVDRGGRSSQ